MNTPVAFILFNRPAVTERVFEAIRQARPTRLLLIADGPRPDVATDAERCRATRAVVDRVDWPCEVLRNFSETNLGCRERIASGLDWVFASVEEAIVLEDDCLPDPSFFPYCEELLERYRHDQRVMCISGDNFQGGVERGPASYYFSCFPHCWGWASWRRAWTHYDRGMGDWPRFRDSKVLNGLLGYPEAARYWEGRFEAVYGRRVGTWDYQWVFACWKQGGLTCLPNRNLVTNIGFGDDATHTTVASSSLSSSVPLEFPLVHPPWVLRDTEADAYTLEKHFKVKRETSIRRSAATLFGAASDIVVALGKRIVGMGRET